MESTSKPKYKSLDFTLASPPPAAPAGKDSCCSVTEGSAQAAGETRRDSCCEVKGEEAKIDACCTPDAGRKQDEPTAFPSGFQKSYTISGMDCPSCVNTIVKGLKSVHAIQDVSLNFNTSKMQVYAEDPAVFDRIAGEVKKLGFAAEEVLPSGSSSKTYEIDGMDCSS